MPTPPQDWPSLSYSDWADTKKTLHLYSQLLGKTRLALSPPVAEWLGSCLYLSARGLTTGPMPWGTSIVEVEIDLTHHSLDVLVSDGRNRSIPLLPARSVAEIYSALENAYGELGITVDMWERPQEIANVTPFSEDTEHATYDAEKVERWWRVLTAVRNTFEEWQSPFFGRHSIQFWWGAFDLSLLRFTGKSAEAPDDRGYIMRYDLDAEFMTAGFWPGDDDSPDPVFFSYIHPKPMGCELAPMNPTSATWIETMGEWILPYKDVAEADDPKQAIVDFLDSVYRIAGTHGGWDLDSYTYTPPAKPKRDG